VKIAYKLICAGVAFLVPIGGLAYVCYDSGQERQQMLERNMIQNAAGYLDNIDRILVERYGDVQVFAGQNALRDEAQWYRPDSPIVANMNVYMELYDVYDITLLVDLKGKPIAVNSRAADGRPIDNSALWSRNFAGESWFRDSLAGKFAIPGARPAPGNEEATGTVVVDAHESDLTQQGYGDKHVAVGFAAPVKGADGALIAVWYNLMNINAMQAILAAKYAAVQKAGLPSAHFTLIDSKGSLVIDLDPSVRGIKPVTQASLNAAAELERKAGVTNVAASGERGSRVDEYGGRRTVTAFAPSVGANGFSGIGWSLIFRANEPEALAPVHAGYRKAIAGVLFALAVLAAIIWYGLRSISKPLVRMTESARKLALGDIRNVIDHKSDDEVGELADALRDVSGWLGEVSTAADAVSRGDLTRSITKRSEADVLSQSFERAQVALKKLDADAASLIVAVREGRLAERAQLSGHEGAYQKLLGGLNELVESCAAPIRDARAILDKVADKNLTERMTGDYRGEWGAIKTGLNKAVDNLDDALGQVVVAADQVTTAATEITIGNQSLAQAATEQSGALDQVTNRLQGVTTSGKQTASNAQEARGMAQAANDAASRGGKAMTELSSAIESIKSASDRTAQIVKTIDEIAFQTNLLALNAAVEAARAGDAGRGFAVVAEEVRNLAMRSAEAARSTSQMIEDAVKSAERGVTLNVSVAKSFDEIRDHVGRVVEVMAEIAAASQQQAAGVAEINGMVDEVSRATQQNAATTEESASAAEELSGQAESLKELVETFALNGAAQATRPAVRARQAAPVPSRSPAKRPLARVVHLRSVPPPAARSAARKGEQLIPFDDEAGARALSEF